MNELTDTLDLVGRLAQKIDLNDESSFIPQPRSSTADAPFAPDVEAISFPGPPAAQIAIPAQGIAGPLAILDLEALRIAGFLTPQSDRSLMAEEYRIIKRPILRTAFNIHREYGDRFHTAMITSARPGEGKTFTTVNLGISIASEHDLHVLLIDGDVRQRGLSRALGLADRKGLMDVLSDPNISLADVILRTNIPHLSILPAGQAVDNPTEILASQRMKDLISEITHRYPDRFILFDSPPVLATSEPGVLAAYVGQVIMVVLANETTKQAITESLGLIDACPNINFILNKVTLSAGSDRFGYDGYYEG